MNNQQKNYTIKSPLVLNGETLLIDTISVDTLITGYQKSFEIDVKLYFKGVKEIAVYECIHTGYRFYYPFHMDGDSIFYQKLEKLSWYYMPWKWEHKVTMKLLRKGDKVLEVGSGGLGFAKKLKDHGFDITGLELNKESVVAATEVGLNIQEQTVQNHAISNFESYDVVCSYQVLEHITEVSSFLRAQVDCLKQGGKLIICVPNNDSFIKYSKGGLLNFPPHHMGLWNKKSLTSIAKLYNLRVDKVLFEPLQEYHIHWYANSMITEVINKIPLLRRLFLKLKLKGMYMYFIKKFKNTIKGHSIMVVYTKNKDII